MKNSTTKYRVGQLEVKVDKLDEKVDDIMENHLPHLKQAIMLNTWKIGAIVGIVSAVGGVLLNRLISYL